MTQSGLIVASVARRLRRRKWSPGMRNAHPSADFPADIPKPAFPTADQHTRHQEAKKDSDSAYKTASHLIPELTLAHAGSQLHQGFGCISLLRWQRTFAALPVFDVNRTGLIPFSSWRASALYGVAVASEWEP